MNRKSAKRWRRRESSLILKLKSPIKSKRRNRAVPNRCTLSPFHPMGVARAETGFLQPAQDPRENRGGGLLWAPGILIRGVADGILPWYPHHRFGGRGAFHYLMEESQLKFKGTPRSIDIGFTSQNPMP